MQVRVRTNLVPSNAFGLVQMLQEIVLGRLRGRIRRLFFVGAVIRVEMRGERGLFLRMFRKKNVKYIDKT